MVKEGEGSVELKKDSSLQKATGQGKETEGIKYPYPAPHVLAFIENEFGSLEKIKDEPERHAYQMGLMITFYLEMQKGGRLKEIVVMTKKERQEASVDLFEKENFDMGKINSHIKAAMEVFGNAQGARRKAKKNK